MERTWFQRDRGKRWDFWCMIIVIAVISMAVIARVVVGVNHPVMLATFIAGMVFYTVGYFASNSRTLLGEYRYFVWEKDGQVKEWNIGIEPKEFFAFGLPTHGIGLKPVVIIPKNGNDGWSLRLLRNGDLMLRDREGAQQRFVFRIRENDTWNATEVLKLLRDAYWADTSVADKDGHGTIWWAQRRREHRYWEAENPRRVLVDAFALLAGRTDKSRKTNYPNWIRSPLGVWVHEFCQNVLGVNLSSDDPRRAELGVSDHTPTLEALVAAEVKAGPNVSLPQYTPAGSASETSSA